MTRAIVVALALALAACRGPRAPAPPAPALVQLEAARDLAGAPIGHADAPTLVVVFASWCQYCRGELLELTALRAAHPELRVVGVAYHALETYDRRAPGTADALHTFVATTAPWLRVVDADDALYAALGAPATVPATFAYAAGGALLARFDRRARAAPRSAELAAAFGW